MTNEGQKGMTIGWYGVACEPRVITIWDKKAQKDQLEKMRNIESYEDFDLVFEEYIYEYDPDSHIWNYQGKLFIDSEGKDWEFNNPGEPNVMKLLAEKYKDQEICIISFDVVKASGEFPTPETKCFDETELRYDDGIITYKGEEMDVVESRGVSSERCLFKFGKEVNL